MFARTSRLFLRVRKETSSEPAIGPPRTWADEVAKAGTTADEWTARRRRRSALPVNVGDAAVDWMRRECDAQVTGTIAAASRVLRHEFDLLGSGPYRPDDPDRSPAEDGYRPIDWYLDPVSGLRFPQGVPLGDWNFDAMRPGRADIKLPWELSRCQHWPLLGQAYRLSGDDRFAVEIANQLRDFVAANPIGTAVNWSCTMDVALRAANWAIGLELVKASPALTSEFWRDAYVALFEHGAFIETHLENTYEVTSNHFLSNIVGLLYVAAVFDDLPCGAVWNRRCRQWLAEEIDVQVLADGADYESSVPYHRLVTELFLGAARLADYAADPLPQNILDRLPAMIEFLAAVLRPDGLMPQIGDADDGRLHVLSGYGTWRPQDARHLFGPAAAMFRRADWAALGGESGRWEAVWWGLDPLEPAVSSPELRADFRHFPMAGLTVMRRGRHYLLVTNGRVGTAGFGNHKHNDLLGFEYHVDGIPIFVDAGSYVYTSDPEARNLFRGTRSHNTMSVDGEEQNELRPEWLFRMFERANPEHLELRHKGEWLRYRGRHYGYAQLSQPVVVERTFALSIPDGRLTITDVLKGEGRHRLDWHFHFAPNVGVTLVTDDRIEIRTAGVALGMRLPCAVHAVVAPAWYSPSYGVREPCLGVDLFRDEEFAGRHEYGFEIAVLTS